MSTLCLRVAAAGLALAAAAHLHAQQAGTFRAAVDLVPVFVTVTGPDGAYAAGLTKDDFTVLDNGKPQEIVSFSDQAQAISVSLILDTSSSMAAALPRVFDAAGTFLEQLRPDDRAMVGTLFYQGPPFTSDKARIRDAMGLVPPDPGSPVWGALDRALTTLEPEMNRRVVVMYTDGKNSPMRLNGRPWPPSGATESSVRTRVESAGVRTICNLEGRPTRSPLHATNICSYSQSCAASTSAICIRLAVNFARLSGERWLAFAA